MLLSLEKVKRVNIECMDKIKFFLPSTLLDLTFTFSIMTLEWICRDKINSKFVKTFFLLGR